MRVGFFRFDPNRFLKLLRRAFQSPTCVSAAPRFTRAVTLSGFAATALRNSTDRVRIPLRLKR